MNRINSQPNKENRVMLIHIDIKKPRTGIRISQMQFINQEIKEDKKVCRSIHEMVWVEQRTTEFRLPNQNMNENNSQKIWAAFRLKLECPGK